MRYDLSSAGNTRGLIEACGGGSARIGRVASSAGNTRGLIEANSLLQVQCVHSSMSSAGNTRGLIEAPPSPCPAPDPAGLPRGIPAASLKQLGTRQLRPREHGLPRGIPAASLKRLAVRLAVIGFTAGLPRGIPAASLKPVCPRSVNPRGHRLPRGIPAASLKQQRFQCRFRGVRGSSAGNTRGLIEAPPGAPCASAAAVFRGEYPRPH